MAHAMCVSVCLCAYNTCMFFANNYIRATSVLRVFRHALGMFTFILDNTMFTYAYIRTYMYVYMQSRYSLYLQVSSNCRSSSFCFKTRNKESEGERNRQRGERGGGGRERKGEGRERGVGGRGRREGGEREKEKRRR